MAAATLQIADYSRCPREGLPAEHRQTGDAQRGFWRALAHLAGPVAGPLEWVEPVVE